MKNSSPYFAAKNVKLYNCDFLSENLIENESIDLIVTSPPYNLKKDYGSTCSDDVTYGAYLTFMGKWLKKAYRLLKSDGRLCLNMSLDNNLGGRRSTYADVGVLVKSLNWKYHSTIIWNKSGSAGTAWGSWLSASAPNVVAPVEVIVVLYKSVWKKAHHSKKSDMTKEEFIEWTNGVWKFMPETKARRRRKHPAIFPVELPRRCIKMFSFVGDVVLDPFVGSGTTLIACVEVGRVGIGVEISEPYCAYAKQRLVAEAKINQLRIFEYLDEVK